VPPNAYTRFSLTVSHSQENHRILKENAILEDSIQPRTYKYYKFTVHKDDSIKNVEVVLDTLHGDADIYMSNLT
jgi:hypothetical protein